LVLANVSTRACCAFDIPFALAISIRERILPFALPVHGECEAARTIMTCVTATTLPISGITRRPFGRSGSDHVSMCQSEPESPHERQRKSSVTVVIDGEFQTSRLRDTVPVVRRMSFLKKGHGRVLLSLGIAGNGIATLDLAGNTLSKKWIGRTLIKVARRIKKHRDGVGAVDLYVTQLQTLGFGERPYSCVLCSRNIVHTGNFDPITDHVLVLVLNCQQGWVHVEAMVAMEFTST
jgi:hypothetical protein